MNEIEDQRLARRREQAYQRYWRNAERIRERNRVYHYRRLGMSVPEKKIYKLRPFEERTKAIGVAKASAVAKATKKIVTAAKEQEVDPAKNTESVSFVLTAADFK